MNGGMWFCRGNPLWSSYKVWKQKHAGATFFSGHLTKEEVLKRVCSLYLTFDHYLLLVLHSL